MNAMAVILCAYFICGANGRLLLAGPIETITDDASIVRMKSDDITSISLSGRRITDAGLNHLAEFKSLTLLQVFSVKERLDFRALGRAKSLRVLYITGVRIEPEEIKAMTTLPELHELHLSKVGDFDVDLLAPLGNAPKLEVLELSNGHISEDGMSEVAKLASLRILNLYGTNTDDDSAKTISSIKSLEVVNLRGTNVSDVTVKHLVRLKNLRFVDLRSTMVTAASRELFERHLPSAKVLMDEP